MRKPGGVCCGQSICSTTNAGLDDTHALTSNICRKRDFTLHGGHVKWKHLPTEAINKASIGIDRMSTADIVALMAREDREDHQPR